MINTGYTTQSGGIPNVPNYTIQPINRDGSWNRDWYLYLQYIGTVLGFGQSSGSYSDQLEFAALSPSYQFQSNGSGSDLLPAMVSTMPGNELGIDPRSQINEAALDAVQSTLLGISQRFEF